MAADVVPSPFLPLNSPLISRMRSTWEMTYWIVLKGVAGFSTTPAFTPRSLICRRDSHATQTMHCCMTRVLVEGVVVAAALLAVTHPQFLTFTMQQGRPHHYAGP